MRPSFHPCYNIGAIQMRNNFVRTVLPWFVRFVTTPALLSGAIMRMYQLRQMNGITIFVTIVVLSAMLLLIENELELFRLL